jgi:hypothetical protein
LKDLLYSLLNHKKHQLKKEEREREGRVGRPEHNKCVVNKS